MQVYHTASSSLDSSGGGEGRELLRKPANASLHKGAKATQDKKLGDDRGTRCFSTSLRGNVRIIID